MSPDGADIYEPSLNEREALARRFHPDFTWSMLRDDERKGLLAEWRTGQIKKEPPKRAASPVAAARAVSEADFIRVVDTVKKLAELQPLATKATAQVVVRTVGRVLHPVIMREQQQRADLQRDLSRMRREWAEQSRRFNDLLSGLLVELCVHKRDENYERAERL